jgi:pyruvate formate lyase activating enzyme
MVKARIVSVKRFEIHDGEGIRTTLFLKGCPLKCLWCHNPEAISPNPQLSYLKNKCINCGECISLCGAHILTDTGKHLYNRDMCVYCGRCESVCLGNALTFYGKNVTPREILPQLLDDRMFYEASNGGVTISGGEPLMQADFCSELLSLLKLEGINTAIDTCGYAPQKEIDKVIEYTDSFLYDVKFFDEKKHIKYTGQSNSIILDNLKYIDSFKKSIEIRIPFIPTINEDQIEPIGKFLSSLKHIKKIIVLPIHNFSSIKYEALEMYDTLSTIPVPNEEMVAKTLKILKSFSLNNVLSAPC